MNLIVFSHNICGSDILHQRLLKSCCFNMKYYLWRCMRHDSKKLPRRALTRRQATERSELCKRHTRTTKEVPDDGGQLSESLDLISVLIIQEYCEYSSSCRKRKKGALDKRYLGKIQSVRSHLFVHSLPRCFHSVLSVDMPPQITETTSISTSHKIMTQDAGALSALHGLKTAGQEAVAAVNPSAGAAAAAATAAAAANANNQSNTTMTHLIDAAAIAAFNSNQDLSYEAAAAMLNSTAAATAYQSSKGPHKKRAASMMSDDSDKSQHMSEEDKKAERRAANRRSAFQSRQRRKILIEDLQRTVAALSKENTDLRKHTDDIRLQLEQTLIENQQLRVAVAREAGGSATSPQVSATLAPTAFSSQTPSAAAHGTTSPGPTAASNQTLSQLLQRQESGASAAAAAAAAAAETERLINAKLALLAAQNRVSELERAQQPAVVTATSSPWATALGSGGLDHFRAAAAMGDATQLARIQELLMRSSAAPAASPSAPNINAELANLRRLMELREQQQQHAVAALAAAGNQAASAAAAPKTPTDSTMAAAPAPTPTHITAPSIPNMATPAPTPRDAPGLHLLLESLRANGPGGTAPNQKETAVAQATKATAPAAAAAPPAVVSTNSSSSGAEMDKIMAAATAAPTSST
jgi:hypothetical protein